MSIKSTVVTDNTINAQINPSAKIVSKQIISSSFNKDDVGLGNVDNTSDVSKPISTVTQIALNLKANQADVYSKSEVYTRTQVDNVVAEADLTNTTYVDAQVAGIVNSAPAALDTLNELAAALGDDANYAATTATLIGQKQDTLTFGIANTNAVKMDNTSAAPGGGDIAIFASTGIMPKTFASLKSDMGIPTLRSDVDQNITDIAGKQDTLTFGIANTNAVKMDNTSAAPGGGDLAMFASTGIMPKTFASLKSDLGVDDKAPINNPSFTGNSTNFSGLTNFDKRVEITPVSGRGLYLYSSGSNNQAVSAQIEGPTTVGHDLFQRSGFTNGFADGSNHFHSLIDINLIEQEAEGDVKNTKRVQERYYAIQDNFLPNNKAVFWAQHRVARPISTTVIDTSTATLDVSLLQNSSNRNANNQVFFVSNTTPLNKSEELEITLNSHTLSTGDSVRMEFGQSFAGPIVAAQIFGKVTTTTTNTFKVELYGGNYKTSSEVPLGTDQTALTFDEVALETIGTNTIVQSGNETNLQLYSKTNFTPNRLKDETVKATWSVAHGLVKNEHCTLITDGRSDLVIKQAAYVLDPDPDSDGLSVILVYGRRIKQFDLGSFTAFGSSNWTLHKGSIDGIHDDTLGDNLINFNANNHGDYTAYQIGPGSQTDADCIAIGKNVYNKDASTIKIGYDNEMLDVRSDGIAVAGDLTVDTTTLKVDSANNRVGIGTASPGTPLAVVGASTLNGTVKIPTANASFTKQRCYNKSGGIRLQKATSVADEIIMRYEGANSNNFVIEQYKDHDSSLTGQSTTHGRKGQIKFVGGENILRLTAGSRVELGAARTIGNLDIGVPTTNSSEMLKLTFKDSRTQAHGLHFEHSGNNAVIQMGRYDSYPSTTEGDFKITSKTGNNAIQEILTIEATSNRITLEQPVRIQSRIIHKGTTQASFGFTGAQPATNVFDITTSNVQRLRVNSTGEVGIGKTAASGVELDVNGDIAASGSITVATAPTTGNHLTNKTYVDTQVASIVDSAPAALDTLNELAAALGDDASFATTTATSIGEKLAKASNLSDLANAATARTNLGLGTAATTASSDYATPAQVAAKQDTLTFGIANTNAVKMDNTSAAPGGGDLAMFASNGIMPKTFASLKSDLGVDNKAPLANPIFTGDLTSDTDTLKVDSTNDRVGIGTTTPAEKLDVVGNIKASGSITSSNGSVLASHGNFTIVSGTCQTAAQPNITSVGTLAGLNVSSAITSTDTNLNVTANGGNLVLTGNQGGSGGGGVSITANGAFALSSDNIAFSSSGLSISSASSVCLAINDSSGGTDFINADISTGKFDVQGVVHAKGYSLNANTFTVVSTTSTLAAATNGLTVILQNTGPITITLPTLAAGHVTTFISETIHGVTFVGDTGITVNSFGGVNTTAGIFAQCQVIYKTTAIAFLGGNLS